jgi:hypothetical protein
MLQSRCHCSDRRIQEWTVLGGLNDKWQNFDPGTADLVVIQVELGGRFTTDGRKVLHNEVNIVFELVQIRFW